MVLIPQSIVGRAKILIGLNIRSDWRANLISPSWLHKAIAVTINLNIDINIVKTIRELVR